MERRRILFTLLALMACLLCSMSAKAQEAYACYTPDNTTLTFYYDDQRSAREGTTYDLNTGDDEPGWYYQGINYDVTQVVFDPSFAHARPISTKRWFAYMEYLESFTGMGS